MNGARRSRGGCLWPWGGVPTLPVLWSSLWLCPGAGEVGPPQKEARGIGDSGSPKPHAGPGPAEWLLGGALGTALMRDLARSQLLPVGLWSPGQREPGVQEAQTHPQVDSKQGDGRPKGKTGNAGSQTQEPPLPVSGHVMRYNFHTRKRADFKCTM